ncbi:MAG: phosphate ABC transporter permease subunit PstC [Pseudomonadota bacterium]
MHVFHQVPMGWLAFTVLAAAGLTAFLVGRGAGDALAADSSARMNSQPNYHGYYVAMWTVVPAAASILAYAIFGEGFVRSVLASELPDGFDSLNAFERTQYLDRAAAALRLPTTGQPLFDAVVARYGELRGAVKLAFLLAAAALAALGFVLSRRRIAADFRARLNVEGGIQAALFVSAAIAIATTVGIVVSLLYESFQFFTRVSLFDFLFGLEWNAQTNTDFGAVPLFFGTFAISLIAMAVAAPIGLYAAIYLSEYASPRMRGWVKPVLEVLAGIPTVVYGFFAILVVAPLVRSAALWINGLPFTPPELLAAQPASALAAGLVMGVMIIPFVSSLSDDVINAVPQTLRDGAYAMGATKSETVKQVVLPAALPGVIAALLLAVSRAIGETMIVTMAAGQRAQISVDPTSDITTITAQIVSLLTGDSEFDNSKTLSAFALGFVLFLVTLCFNLIALRVVQRYREKYD